MDPLLLRSCYKSEPFILNCINHIKYSILINPDTGVAGDRVHFLLSQWYSAVLWIWCDNNVDNTLMFWSLLCGAYPEPRTFQRPTLCQRAGAQEAGEARPGQLIQAGQRTTGCCFQSIIWGKLVRSC